MGPYAPLLAAAAKPFGGASAADWLSVLSSRLDSHRRQAVKPLAQSLADLSGYVDHLPLFSGVPAWSSGRRPLEIAHAAAFGTAIEMPTLLAANGADASGISDLSSLPRRLADELLRENSAIFRSAMQTWVDGLPDAIRPGRDAMTWLFAQKPNDLVPPEGMRQRALAAGLDWHKIFSRAGAIARCVSIEIVERTSAALRRDRLPGQTIESKAERCLNLSFLLRHFRRVVWRGLESMHLHGKLVGALAPSNYVSATGFQAWVNAKRRQLDWLNRTMVSDTHGLHKSRLLADVVRTPDADLAELVTFLAGVETLAREDGLAPVLLTLTLPPVWHPNPTYGLSSWGGSAFTPDKAIEWLNDEWAKFLRDLDNRQIPIAGLRVIEPHKDGCPHAHALVYLPPECESDILLTLCSRFNVAAIKVKTTKLSSSGHLVTHTGRRYQTVVTHFDASTQTECAGDGRAHRIEWCRINQDVATATSYVSKYLRKNFSLAALDEAKPDASTAAAAHAAGWGYRRFAFFGIRSSKTLWRELRRTDKPVISSPTGYALLEFAKSGDFASFLRLLGGLRAGGGLKVRALHDRRINSYGDNSLVLIGAEVIDQNDNVVVRVVTHEPGRYELVPLECVGASPPNCETEPID